VEELFEARKPKGEAITVDYEGEVVEITRSVGRWVVIKAKLPVGDLLVGKMSLETLEDPKSGAVILEEMEEIRVSHLARLEAAGVQEVTVLDAVLVPSVGSLEVVKGDTVLTRRPPHTWTAEPARTAASARRARRPRVPHPRDSGGLQGARRRHRRQAPGGHHPPDAAQTARD
jgi:hypothetical protein